MILNNRAANLQLMDRTINMSKAVNSDKPKATDRKRLMAAGEDGTKLVLPLLLPIG